jgi:hypothetical protein
MRSCGYFEFFLKLIQKWELFLRDSVLIQTWELFYLFWIMEIFFVIIWTIEDRMLIFRKMRCVSLLAPFKEKLFSPSGEPRHLSTIPIIKRHVC